MTVSDNFWLFLGLFGMGGLGLGIGLVVGAFVARMLRRYIRDETHADDEEKS